MGHAPEGEKMNTLINISICVLCVLLVLSGFFLVRLKGKLFKNRLIAMNTYYDLIHYSVAPQIEKVILDYRKRGKVFPNQLKLLNDLCSLLGKIATIGGVCDQEVKCQIEDVANRLEGERFKNVLYHPPAIKAKVNSGHVDILVRGENIEHWQEIYDRSKNSME